MMSLKPILPLHAAVLFLVAGAQGADGEVVGWGSNGDGQFNVPDSAPFVAISASNSHSLGLTAGGAIAAWGAGGPGQSGYPHYGQSIVPEPNQECAGLIRNRMQRGCDPFDRTEPLRRFRHYCFQHARAGRSDSGAVLSPGVYLVLLRQNGFGSNAERVVLLP